MANSKGNMSTNVNVAKPNIIVKPIVYGNISRQFAKKRENDGHTHDWTVYVKPFDNEDMSAYVKRVQFRLHESYAEPNRVVTKPPYEVSETGWGEFEIQIKIYFNEPLDRPVVLYHVLKLFHTPPTPTVSPTIDERPSGSRPMDIDVKGDMSDPMLASTVSHMNMGRKTVISESYEELLFGEPNQYVQAMLTITRPLTLNAHKHETDIVGRQDAALGQLKRARTRVQAETEQFKAALKRCRSMLIDVRNELLIIDKKSEDPRTQTKRK